MWRRLRSLIPTSPFPWHWHARFYRALLVAILVLGGGRRDLGAGPAELRRRARRRAPGAEDEPRGHQGPRRPDPGAEGRRGRRRRHRRLLRREHRLEGAARRGRDRRRRLGGRRRRAWSGACATPVPRAGRIPPFVIGLQEGGVYRAYPDLPPAESQLDIGLTGDPQAARAWSEETAKALKSAGFDLNLGPLADVAGPASSIADRSFSDDPELATTLVGAAVKGCEGTGVACAVPHFPGLGAASDDTDVNPATVSLDPASLEARDLGAFRAAFDAGAPATVLSLAFYTAYDPITPAALPRDRDRPAPRRARLRGPRDQRRPLGRGDRGRPRRTRGRGPGDRGGNRPRDGRRPGSGGPGPRRRSPRPSRTAASRSSAWTTPSPASCS